LPLATTAIVVRLIGWRPIGASTIVARDASRRELSHEVGLRLDRLRDDHEPARVLVETMHDAGTRNRGKRGVMVQQRIQQCTFAIAAPRMHDEARRLVDDENRVVLEHDRKRDVLRRIDERGFLGQGHDIDVLASRDTARGFPRFVIDRDASRVDPRAKARARMRREETRERLVEAHSRELRGDRVRMRGRVFAAVARVGGGAPSAIIRRTHEGCGRRCRNGRTGGAGFRWR
jgi:hypothetical protein